MQLVSIRYALSVIAFYAFIQSITIIRTYYLTIDRISRLFGSSWMLTTLPQSLRLETSGRLRAPSLACRAFLSLLRFLEKKILLSDVENIHLLGKLLNKNLKASVHKRTFLSNFQQKVIYHLMLSFLLQFLRIGSVQVISDSSSIREKNVEQSFFGKEIINFYWFNLCHRASMCEARSRSNRLWSWM